VYPKFIQSVLLPIPCNDEFFLSQKNLKEEYHMKQHEFLENGIKINPKRNWIY
jgi:hypothetical protein